MRRGPGARGRSPAGWGWGPAPRGRGVRSALEIMPMKQALLYGPYDIRVEDVPDPQPEPGQVPERSWWTR